jgi:hypothetical protein
MLIGDESRMQCCDNNKYPILLPNPITQVADMPYPLYLSLQGKYFVGYADEMVFGNGTIAWAGLVNPVNSGVNLHVYVWTVTNIGQLPLQAEVWFNTDPPGRPVRSELVTPANTAIRPLPRPKVKLLEASNVTGEPEGGIKMFERSVDPEITIASEENGALIFPPGGSLIITLSYPEAIDELGLGRVAFGWSEEDIK